MNSDSTRSRIQRNKSGFSSMAAIRRANCAVRPVNDAMVVAQRERQHESRNDLTVFHHGL